MTGARSVGLLVIGMMIGSLAAPWLEPLARRSDDAATRALLVELERVCGAGQVAVAIERAAHGGRSLFGY